ncbi:hypothetical protein SHPE106448_11145 [Shewanella pealeana]
MFSVVLVFELTIVFNVSVMADLLLVMDRDKSELIMFGIKSELVYSFQLTY